MAATKTDNEIKIIATNDAKLDDLPVVNGQIIFSQDTQQVYLDYNDERKSYSSSGSGKSLAWGALGA